MALCGALRVRAPVLALAAGLSMAICHFTGLIAGWGRWYSHDLVYRRQTLAFFQGTAALADEPTALAFDMAWAEGGVQQVWGLGVPAWRMLGELLARAVGQPAFPDRVALAIAIALAAYAILAAFLPPAVCRTAAGWLGMALDRPEQLLAALLLILFPPMLVLCRGPFNVYEEPVVYGYYYAVTLFVLVLDFARAPRFSLYLSIGALAGLVGFVRPTLFVYGIAAATIVAFIAWSGRDPRMAEGRRCNERRSWGWLKIAAVVVLVAAGGFALFMSNRQRFGAGIEFGHNLNATGGDIMFASRFGAPFEQQPLGTRLRELFGALFFVNRLNGVDNFQKDAVRWQMPVERWRHFYSRTYDASYVLVVAISLAIGFRQMLLVRGSSSAKWSLITLGMFWTLASGMLLAAFYVGYYSLSSRYMLDFAPAFAASAAGLVAWAGQAIRVRRAQPAGLIALITLTVVWWGGEMYLAETSLPGQSPWAQVHVLDAMAVPPARQTCFPTNYDLRHARPSDTEILFNGFGWDLTSGQAGPFVMLFVKSLGKLQLELEPLDARGAPSLVAQVRAKVGLECLSLQSTQKTKRGYRLTFARPRREAYRHGIQPVFVAFNPPEGFRALTSPWRLTRVTW